MPKFLQGLSLDMLISAMLTKKRVLCIGRYYPQMVKLFFKPLFLSLDYLMKEVKTLRGQLNQISRQLMLQQFFTEEKIRNEGFSGIKQIRTAKGELSLDSPVFFQNSNVEENSSNINV